MELFKQSLKAACSPTVKALDEDLNLLGPNSHILLLASDNLECSNN